MTGLSIGYGVPRGGHREPDARLKALGVSRIIDKINLREVSPVLFPMNAGARVTYERKRASHIARYGAAPKTIPFVLDGGMVPILGVTQAYLYGLKLSAAALVKMESVREGLTNPPKPEPKPVLTEKERRELDKRYGVVARARRPASWDTPSAGTEERR